MARHWAVCRVLSNRVHIVRSDIEKCDHGTFLPTFTRVWSSGGKLSCRQRALMPGYLFFMTSPDGWGEVRNIPGVLDVIARNETASRVTDDEMFRLVIGHAARSHDEADLRGLDRPKIDRKTRRRRRPRPGKRLRSVTKALA